MTDLIFASGKNIKNRAKMFCTHKHFCSSAAILSFQQFAEKNKKHWQKLLLLQPRNTTSPILLEIRAYKFACLDFVKVVLTFVADCNTT